MWDEQLSLDGEVGVLERLIIGMNLSHCNHFNLFLPIGSTDVYDTITPLYMPLQRGQCVHILKYLDRLI